MFGYVGVFLLENGKFWPLAYCCGTPIKQTRRSQPESGQKRKKNCVSWLLICECSQLLKGAKETTCQQTLQNSRNNVLFFFFFPGTIHPQDSRLHETPNPQNLFWISRWQSSTEQPGLAPRWDVLQLVEGVGHLLPPYLGLKNEGALQRQGASPLRSTGGSRPVMRGPAHTALTYFVPGRNGGEWQLVSVV